MLDRLMRRAVFAETDGIEGEFYVWDATEIDNVLGATAIASGVAPP